MIPEYPHDEPAPPAPSITEGIGWLVAALMVVLVAENVRALVQWWLA